MLLVALLVSTGCGQENDDGPAVSTHPPATTAPVAVRVLRADGIGPIDFGSPEAVAQRALVRLLGAPDRIVVVASGAECVEGSDWRECIPVAREGSVAVWDDRGLEVAFADRRGDGATARVVPPFFHSWRATRPRDGRALATIDGLEPGATVAELRRIYPEVTFLTGEGGVVDTFRVVPAEDSIWGLLDTPRQGAPSGDAQIRALYSGT